MPSGDATTDFAREIERRIGRTGAYLAGREMLGFVWLDERLVVEAIHGELVSFCEVGRPIVESFPALMGLERDLVAHREASHLFLELPGVSIATAAGTSPSLNVIAFWDAAIGRHTLQFESTESRLGLEIELSRQMRARLLAEEAVVEKSRELARVNAELERANGDLEEYASIISHDLASPLRALRQTAEAIARDIGERAPAGITELLHDLDRQSVRMSGMLTALLDYASAGRKDDVAELVDTNELAVRIAASIPRPPGISVVVEGEWPIVTTLAAPLDLVLRNLVDNAVKHHDRDAGRIAIAAAPSAHFLSLTVTDDGPGIGDTARASVFLPYRTLSAAPRSGVPGLGMGLAIVTRTLHSLGGAIEVKDRDDGHRGTVFEVRWPLPETSVGKPGRT